MRFATTYGAAGVDTLTMTNAARVVVSTQTVTVHAAQGAGGAAAVTPRAHTGFDLTGILVGGGLLVLVGAGAVLVARRRKSANVSA